MKTNTRKTTRILCASTIAAMTLLGSVAPALTTVAAEGSTTPVTSEATTTTETPTAKNEGKLDVSSNTITFDKKIYLDENEYTPHVKIGYELSPRTVQAGTAEYNSLSKYGNVIAGTKSDEIKPSDTVFNENSEKGEGYVYEKSTIHAEKLVDGLTAPTVFTYTLTEVPANDFITAKAGTTRKLNIYVGYASEGEGKYSDTLSVLYATLADTNDKKADGFENNYVTSDNDDTTNAFKITKKVTGNQGDKTAGFNFTVTINNQYSRVKAETDGTSLTSSIPDDHHNVTVKVTLKDGQSLTLKGLTEGATYQVAEDNYQGDGYKTEIGERKTVDKTEETVVTNTREGTIPTGIYLNHKLPFNILGVALAGGAVALIAKKRHEEAFEDEDDE